MNDVKPGSVVQEAQWTFPALPDRVWPILADTDQFGRSLGLPPVTYSDRVLPNGDKQKVGSMTYMGVLPVSWDEKPYDWVEGQEHSVKRVMHGGPLESYYVRTRLEPLEGGTRVTVTFVGTPRSLVFKPLVASFAGGVMRGIARYGQRLGDFFAGRAADPFDIPPADLLPSARDRGEAIVAKLQGLGLDDQLVRRVVDYVLLGPEWEMSKIRPFGLAKKWGVDRRELLKVFLHATSAGLLELRWDLLCPGCRDGTDPVSSLQHVRSGSHCGSCNIDFNVTFDQSVEISFRPSPAVRKVEPTVFCVSGPFRTPHVVVRRQFQPGGSNLLELALEPGTYRVRCYQYSTHMTVTLQGVGPDAGSTQRVAVSPSGFQPGTLDLDSSTLRLSLEVQEPVQIVVERTMWADDVVTAAYVSSMQDFRTLFSSEMLAPDLNLSVGNVAIMFTDLKSSTAMYEQLGDATAFNLVQVHFRILAEAIAANQGAIVKTVGDAVMATFYRAEDCVRAAFEIQASIDRYNEENPQKAAPIIVKLGAHVGPCIAVTLNERLDYFGTTVNVAARVQNESIGEDIVLSEDILTDPGVQAMMGVLPIRRSEPFEVSLKGLAKPFALTRVHPDLANVSESLRRHTGEIALQI